MRANERVQLPDRLGGLVRVRERLEETEIRTCEEVPLLGGTEYHRLDRWVGLDAIDDGNEVVEDRRAERVHRFSCAVKQHDGSAVLDVEREVCEFHDVLSSARARRLRRARLPHIV